MTEAGYIIGGFLLFIIIMIGVHEIEEAFKKYFYKEGPTWESYFKNSQKYWRKK